MKKLILTLILIFAFVGPALAKPFLVCDPQPGVTNYILEINGLETAMFPAEPDGSVRYDLAPLADGGYEVRAKAGNIWGWSGWSHQANDPLGFTKALPGDPSGLHVSLE